jgi:hypothetical protein
MSSARLIGYPALIAGAMAAFAFVVARRAGISGGHIIVDYFGPAASISLVCLLFWIGHQTIVMARANTDKPLERLKRAIANRLAPLTLPALVAPLFLAAFTTAKTCMARVVGFHWDRAFADIDAAIFGTDPWRLTHGIFGPGATWALAFFYTVVFGFALAFVQAFVALYADRRLVGTFFLATVLTWFLGGIVGAYALSSTGPIFAHLADTALGDRFAPLATSLHHLLPGDNLVAPTQTYLASSLNSSIAVSGGGISAMPSMHIAEAMIFVMAAKGTKWQWLAIPFLVLTWVGSVHFGYHYAIDGVVAVPIAILCWHVAEIAYSPRSPVRSPRGMLV